MSSPRLDWCGACSKEHGYDCPKDHPSEKTGWQEEFDRKYPLETTTFVVSRDSILSFIHSQIILAEERVREKIVESIREEVNRLINEDSQAKCAHRELKDIISNNYDCSDIHIGRKEALYDIFSLLDTNNER